MKTPNGYLSTHRGNKDSICCSIDKVTDCDILYISFKLLKKRSVKLGVKIAGQVNKKLKYLHKKIELLANKNTSHRYSVGKSSVKNIEFFRKTAKMQNRNNL